MNDSLQDAKILIVDDQVANICLLQNVLNRIGYKRLECVSDSRETTAQVEQFDPDLIILDLNMPYLDGFAVMSQLSKIIPRETFLPVLVLTADCTSATKRKALAAGAADLLTKPFDATEVFMRIRNLLQMRFMRRQLQDQNLVLEEKVAERTRELRDMQGQVVAQERLRAFGEMAGGVVHDFNNALMSVIGYSEILLENDDMIRDIETVRRFLRIMHTAGKDASHVIGRLRDFYRPREITDVLVPVNLNDLIEEAVPLTQPKWKDQALADGRVINVELDLQKLPQVAANASELREVATNLIFNAVDAMPNGGTITLRTRIFGATVVLEVTDTGSGMTEEVRTRCLEPFFSTKGDKGTGLGLSMVFGIIKRHEGVVEIESELGQGTTFRISLPAQVDTIVAGQSDTTKLVRALRVLVVDDEPVPRDVLQKFLISDGHSVVTANNALEAIRCFQSEPFDLVLTDHAMPGMNGIELASVLRGMRENQPVILVTGFSEWREVPGEQPTGINMMVWKPVPHGELRRALSAVISE